MKFKEIVKGRYKFLITGLILLFVLIDVIIFGAVKFHQAKMWQQTTDVSQKLNTSKMKSGKYAILFYQKGCAYCQKAMPTVQKNKELAAKNHVKYLQVNTRTKIGRELTDDYAIESTPTLLLIDKSKSKGVQIAPITITYDKKKQNKKINKNLIGVKGRTIKNAMKGNWSWVNSY